MLAEPVTLQLLERICSQSLLRIGYISDCPLDFFRTPRLAPMEPVLWNEALTVLLRIEVIANAADGKECDRTRLQQLLDLLEHPVKEVREGVVAGCLSCFQEVIEMEDSNSLDPKLVRKYKPLALGLNTGEEMCLMRNLLRSVLLETVPPVLSKLLRLMRTLSVLITFTEIPASVREEFTRSFPTLQCITVDHLPFQWTADTVAHIEMVNMDKNRPNFVPTECTGYVLELIGWILLKEFEDIRRGVGVASPLCMKWGVLMLEASKEDQNVLIRTAAVRSVLASNCLNVCASNDMTMSG